jgi:signal transduction histidine kinase
MAELEALHAATRRLLDADDREAIASVTVDAAVDVLEFPYSVVWYPASADDALEAAAISESIEPHVDGDPAAEMRHGPGSWLWSAYEADGTRRLTISRAQAASETPLHAVITVPLDDHGVLTVGAAEQAALGDADEKLASILGKNVQAALSRAERERRLDEQNRQLALLNRIVRHDIRNEMQVVLGYGNALREHVDGEAATRLSRLVEAGEHVVDLTDDLRTLMAAILDERVERPVALRSTLAETADRIRAEYESATIRIDGEIPAVDVLADDMLGSVFRNLLVNAVTHNDTAEPHVEVSATAGDGRATVAIADDGPGIPDERREAVFEKEVTDASDAGGVGLYLVRTLVERYGGRVRIEDNEPRGTVVVLEFETVD